MTPECRSGQTRGCASALDCAAERTCAGSPAVWGECRCPEPTDASPDPDAGAAKARLGAACDDDAACPSGAFCLTADKTILFGGSSPIGVCVANCSQHPEACAAFADALRVSSEAESIVRDDDAGVDGDGSAILPSRDALCFERCSIGSTRKKCHAQEHVVCEPAINDAMQSVGYCRPICAVDSDCRNGHCDLRNASCVADPPPAPQSEFGASCDVALRIACEGLCVDLNEQAPICSQRCVFGSADECASGEAVGRQGGCVLTTTTGTIGDTGYCAPLCDCPDDCPNTTDVCDPFMDDVLERTLGRPGVCTTAELALHEPLRCK